MTLDRQSFHLHADGEKAFGYAQAVRAGDHLQIAGTLSVDASFTPLHAGDMSAQIREIYGIIGRTLSAFGATFGNVVSERIFVTDMDMFLAANETRLAVYQGHNFPAATAVEVRRLAFRECLIEIEVAAVLEPGTAGPAAS